MEYKKECPKEHVIRRLGEGTYDTGPIFAIECDGKELARATFNVNTVNQDMIDIWRDTTIKQHQIDFLIQECERLAGIIDELEELRK